MAPKRRWYSHFGFTSMNSGSSRMFFGSFTTLSGLSEGFSRTPKNETPSYSYYSHITPIKNPYRYGTGMGPIIGSPCNHPWYWQLWEAAGGSPALRTAVAKHLERSRRVGAAFFSRRWMRCIFPSSATEKGALVGICLVSLRIPGRLQWRKPGWLGCIGDELLPSLCHEMRIPFWTQQFDVDSFTEIISFQKKKQVVNHDLLSSA